MLKNIISEKLSSGQKPSEINENGHIYEMLGLLCAFLSAGTKVGAGQKD
jgi:hypothetical protein